MTDIIRAEVTFTEEYYSEFSKKEFEKIIKRELYYKFFNKIVDQEIEPEMIQSIRIDTYLVSKLDMYMKEMKNAPFFNMDEEQQKEFTNTIEILLNLMNMGLAGKMVLKAIINRT
jgi:hypothetical protein